MNNAQLYFAIVVPVFAVMVGIVAGILQMNSIGGRFTGMESRFTSMEGRLTSFEASMSARFTSLENSVNTRFASLEARFDTLTGKVIEIDNRLTRVEAILDRH